MLQVTIPVGPVLVAYSGGKDSLAVLDLCVKAGRRVECFFMEFVPGMDYTEYWCSLAEKRWGVKVHRMLHWGTVDLWRKGVFCEPKPYPKIGVNDIHERIREITGLQWIGYGYKSRDSLHRRGMMNQWPGGVCEKRKIFAPLKDWADRDVHSYLDRKRILQPDAHDGKRSTGISLSATSLAYMQEHWPNDYKLILKYFPHAEAQADRGRRINA